MSYKSLLTLGACIHTRGNSLRVYVYNVKSLLTHYSSRLHDKLTLPAGFMLLFLVFQLADVEKLSFRRYSSFHAYFVVPVP